VQKCLSTTLQTVTQSTAGVLTDKLSDGGACAAQFNVRCWQLGEGVLHLAVEIPSNTTASVHVPGAQLGHLFEGHISVRTVEGILAIREESVGVTVGVGSGRFEFTCPLREPAER
jgi:hypothetical protein